MKKTLILGMVLMIAICAAGVSAFAVEAAICPSGMVSYWKFDEGSGTVASDSVDSHSGTLVGPVWTSGQVGNALQFDGLNDRVNLGTWFNYQTFSIALWVNPGATQNTYADIIDTNHDGYYNWVIQQFMNNVNNYGFRNEQSFSLTANTWQHLAITKSGTTCNFYLNGDLVNSQYCDIHYSGAQYLVFGSHYAITTRYWNGIMDEVAFYNRALPLEEIQRQYQNGLVGKGYTTEVCNGIDDDCDGTVDNGLTAPSQSCTVGTGACFATGTQVKTCNGVSGWSNDWGACSAIAGSPTAETCNGIDDDCDGTADEYYACTWTGFFQPVDNLPTLNQVNSGRAIPVKFSLGGNMGLDIFAAGYPKSGAITCSSTATVDAIETTVTAGGSSLTYDPVADQYNYVWKTDKAWTGCRQLVVKLNDGTIHYANFKFK